MTTFIRALCCIALVFLSQSKAFANENDIRAKTVSRTTIIVRDMSSSLEFFQHILGLNIRVDLTLDGEAVNHVMGTDEKKIRIVILQSEEEVTGNIALLTYVGETALPEKKHNDVLEVGEVVLVMEINDIDSVYETVKARGYSIVTPPVVLFPQPNMIKQRQEMMFIGPEGVAINLIELEVPATANDE